MDALAITPAWSTTTPLLPHQREAVAKLLPSRVGALFAEMGTGKSRISIELAQIRQAKIDIIVWCCPVSAKETIRREILKHTDTAPADIHVFDDHTSDGALPNARWFIVGTESISSSNRVTLALRALVTEQTFFIVDESHQIKGHRSRRTERLTLIARTARYRLILTGTPISQGIVDLFAQMRFLSPKILGYHSFYTFAANHLVYSERHRGMIERETNAEYLAARIRPYVYQITKDECLDLPDKRYSRRYGALTAPQEIAYAEAKERILLDEYLLGDDDQWQRQIAIFHLFRCSRPSPAASRPTPTARSTPTRIAASACCARPSPAFQTTSRSSSGANTVTPSRRSAPPWSTIMAPRPSPSTTADSRERERQANLDHWRDRGRFLVATQSAGGQSIDLTRARYVIYYANAFKYSERQQSEDRCHRIGQTRPVTYIDLWSSSGIDERIERALARKENAVAAFREEVEKVRKTNKERLRELVKNL
ncbi:MAG: DEAD/DEAH box helicase [Chromatiales bacterium]|nr:DEAD/DEAH box helicase [Chromatiales bacterium]